MCLGWFLFPIEEERRGRGDVVSYASLQTVNKQVRKLLGDDYIYFMREKDTIPFGKSIHGSVRGIVVGNHSIPV